MTKIPSPSSQIKSLHRKNKHLPLKQFAMEMAKGSPPFEKSLALAWFENKRKTG